MPFIAEARKKKKVNYIHLKKVGRRWKDVMKFRSDLFFRMGDQLYYINAKTEFLFRLLSNIFPINRSLRQTDASIEEACRKILTHFGVQSKALNQKNSNRASSDEFMRSILRIEELPSNTYSWLSRLVNADLRELTQLIGWYEKHDSIKRFLNKAEVPKGSEERTLFDFYQRCVLERGEIVKYQLDGLHERVLSKLNPDRIYLGIGNVFSDRYDRPYKFAQPGKYSFFDYRKIDLVRHRLDQFYHDEIEDMVRLYDANKNKFYATYFRRFPWNNLFQECLAHLTYLPSNNDRMPIFKELRLLFKNKRWMAFYALGLPQVEGLFSEMCLAVNPNSNLKWVGLSKKVSSIRGYYHDYYQVLDYFQYYIPIHRNKFAHTGYDEDFQIKSYDLLVDLGYLLIIFSELDNPLIKIKRLHAEKRIQNFNGIDGFVEYFNSLKSLTKLQIESISKTIKEFENSFLLPRTDIVTIFQNICKKLPVELDTFIDNVAAQFQMAKITFDFKVLNKKQCELLLKRDLERDLLLKNFRHANNTLNDLRNYHDFIYGIVKFSTSIDPDIRKKAGDLQKKYNQQLEIILWLGSRVSEFPEN